MPTATDALTLHQIFSPAFPTGGFAWSHGLETLVAERRVSRADEVRDWAETVLRHGAGRTDAVLFATAARDDDDEGALAELASALAGSAERRRETVEQGAAFAATMRAVWGLELADAPYPVAAGRAVARLDLPVEAALSACLLGIAANLVSAAVRLVPLGQSEGQAVLAALAPVCAEVAAAAMGADPDDLGGFAPLIDAAAMRHETLATRLFRS